MRQSSFRSNRQKIAACSVAYDGPEYFTIFNGETGAAMATDYILNRYQIDGWGGPGGNEGNDNTGNRVDRFLVYDNDLDGRYLGIYGSRGKIRSEMAKKDLETFFNVYIARLKESLITKQADW